MYKIVLEKFYIFRDFLIRKIITVLSLNNKKNINIIKYKNIKNESAIS